MRFWKVYKKDRKLVNCGCEIYYDNIGEDENDYIIYCKGIETVRMTKEHNELVEDD